MSCERRFLADKDASWSPGVRRESSASVDVPILTRLLRGLCVSVVSDLAEQSQFAETPIRSNCWSHRELCRISDGLPAGKQSQWASSRWQGQRGGRSGAERAKQSQFRGARIGGNHCSGKGLGVAIAGGAGRGTKPIWRPGGYEENALRRHYEPVRQEHGGSVEILSHTPV